MARNPSSAKPLFERSHERCSELINSPYSSSAEIFFLGLEFVFVDLAARIPLTKDIERGIQLLLSAFAEKPTNSHDQADDKKRPEQKHHRHHADPPAPPPHRMHFPVPLVHALLGQQRGRL